MSQGIVRWRQWLAFNSPLRSTTYNFLQKEHFLLRTQDDSLLLCVGQAEIYALLGKADERI